MDKFDRMQQLHRILSFRRTPISTSSLADKLECSEKTVYRAIDNLRDYVQAPIVEAESKQGWVYDLTEGDRFQLPGLWLTAQEMHSLAVIIELARELEGGLFGDEIGQVTQAIENLLSSRKIPLEIFRQKVSYLPKKKVINHNNSFQYISSALINQQRIFVTYADYRGRITDREISPIKLVHYDDNWYVDAWCHLREALRSFMVARIDRVKPIATPALQIVESDHAEHYASAYGIFAGKPKHLAKLKFTGNAAREAASYQWHNDQYGNWEGKTYLLEIPYNDDRELLRVLLGYGSQVEVLAPSALKKKLLTTAKNIVTNYDPNWGNGRF